LVRSHPLFTQLSDSGYAITAINTNASFLRLLAPLWVLPEYQGRGVASLLLRDGIELADKKRSPMYLEAMAEARVIYEHFGYQGVEGEGEPFVMIRNPPDGVRVLAEKN
jgi:predicted N-acetyltransferase YhbS